MIYICRSRGAQHEAEGKGSMNLYTYLGMYFTIERRHDISEHVLLLHTYIHGTTALYTNTTVSGKDLLSFDIPSRLNRYASRTLSSLDSPFFQSPEFTQQCSREVSHGWLHHMMLHCSLVCSMGDQCASSRSTRLGGVNGWLSASA